MRNAIVSSAARQQLVEVSGVVGAPIAVPRLARDVGSQRDRSRTERVLEPAPHRARKQLLAGREELAAGARPLRGVLGHWL